MKKTLSINIAGIVFHIEEDAFATLDAYLKSIQAYFQNFEGSKEIIDDIEARIAEKFWNIRETEKTEAISQVHVDALIASLGTVADFKEIEMEELPHEQSKTAATDPSSKKVFRRDLTNKKIGGVASGAANYFEIDPIWVRLILIVGFFAFTAILPAANLVFWVYIACWIAIPGEVTVETDKSYRKFFRDPENKVVGGVMAGISAYTGWDVGLLRVLAVISLFFFGTGAAAYLIIMAITQEAKSVTDKMEMTGEPITLENIEKNIKETFQPDSAEEKTFTRILLFPFRTLAAIFTALKPVLMGIKWFVQYLAGIVLVIIAICFTAALVIATTAGISGMDHGLIGLNFGETGIPFYLLAQDLPAWSIWAAYAAIVPMILGIGIGGLSLLMNRKLTNKTYSYISTTMVIVGWIGLFAAFSFVGRNFQRTASVNQMKEITADSSYVFDVNRESNETMWEKLLGNTIISDELLDEDEEHDFNRGGFSRAQISLEGYDGKTIQIIQFAKSNGLTRSEAEKNAKSIQYNYVVKGNQLVLDSHFGLKNLKFRNQRMRVKVLIPYGVTFGMTREFGYFMENVLDGGYFNEDDGDLFVGSKWTFSMDKGLICLNRQPKKEDSSGNNSDDNGDEPDAPDAPDAPATPDKIISPNSAESVSISKTISPFNSILIKRSGSARIKIVKGKEFKVSYQASEANADFGRLTSVNNRVLTIGDVPSDMILTIECPDLERIDLGGNARTELSGFSLPKFDVILHDFHSLTMQGQSTDLAAAAFDSSELQARKWSSDNAVIAVDNQASMDLNVKKSLKGKKAERANVSYQPYASLKVAFNKNK
jgi:phage shock protein PspC (stress-responsive transcriptional regulator)